MRKQHIGYVESGVPSTGDVESLRGMTRLKHVSTIQTGVTLSGEGDSVDPEWPYLRVANVQVGHVDMREIKTVRVPPDRAAVSMLQTGDVLMTEGGDIDKLGRGALWSGEVPNMLHQNHIFAVRPSKQLDSEFLVYWLDGLVARTYFRTTAKQTTNLAGTNKWTLGNLPVPVLALKKQRAVIDYLDRETARIDTLIEEQQSLIEMLRERRRVLVTRAVCFGVDEDVELRDSGDPVVGLVPHHWTVKAIRYWLESLDGKRIPLSGEERADRRGDFDYYGASGVIDQVDGYLFDEPLVLVSEDGANLLMRSTPIAFAAKGRYWVNNHAHVLRPLGDGDVDFWAQRLEALDVTTVVSGAAQPKLTAGALMGLRVSAPDDVDEQRRIAAYLAEQTSKIDMLVAESERIVELSRERRAALITAAVTGQIDVREMA